MFFTDAHSLERLIAAYFKHIMGDYHWEDTLPDGKTNTQTTRQKVWDREPEPPTLTGLVLYLGFDSRAAFERYEATGQFAATLKRGRLRIEAEYEKKLHQQAPSGAIFALKNLGWNERDTAADEPATPLQIEIIDSGIPTAGDERDVML